MRLDATDYRAINAAGVAVGLCAIVAFGWTVLDILPYGEVTYSNQLSAVTVAVPEETPVVLHVATPQPVKAIYLTSWAAASSKLRKHMFDVVDSTEINSVVIDIKDYTGKISFAVDDPSLVAMGSAVDRISDIKDLIALLHQKGIYVIGRISVFQDSYAVDHHPEWAVSTEEGVPWKDYKGIKWLDAGATPVWDYVVHIAREAYAKGFDELNFDYIRFPSDGDMDKVKYVWSNGRTRSEVMKSFFQHLRTELSSLGAPLSVDLFGMTTSAPDDMGIGQNIVDALPYFDYVAPMVYPSHFGKGFIGYAKPAQHPYEVIKYSMDHALVRVALASSTPGKLRPWLQAFDYGAIYTPDMVRSQMKALYDTGVQGWMLWNAASVYDKAALLPKSEAAEDERNVAAAAVALFEKTASTSPVHSPSAQ